MLGNTSLNPQTANAQGDGVERVHSLLVNAIPAGIDGNSAVANDLVHLQAALDREVRPHTITRVNATNNTAVAASIATAFGAADADDICIFYMGAHGEQVADNNGDEADGLDGRFHIGTDLIRDDDMDTPFNARIAAGNCGAGMVLMFMGCHTGELIVGGSDIALAAPHVVMTSCTSTQKSRSGLIGGHAHSKYGGAGLVGGLSDRNADGAAEADANPGPPNPGGGGGAVTAAELHAYAVNNDEDGPADPQSTAPGSALVVLRYDDPQAHASPLIDEFAFCMDVEEFPDSQAEITIETTAGSETVALIGSTTISVFITPEGEARDTDGDTLEQVQTEIVAMELTGTSSLGPVILKIRNPADHPFQHSLGAIEETANTTSVMLDIPPFTATGTAVSFFDVFFEIEIGIQKLHNHVPKHLETEITHMPAASDATYASFDIVPLFDEDENPAGITIGIASYTPNPTKPAIGGEILRIDFTSLLVAGAAANSIWIIPMAGVTAAGIVGFILKRRFT